MQTIKIGITFIVLFIGISLALSSCKKDTAQPSNPPSTTNEVVMSGMAFMPSAITVNAGTTVKWTNNDNMTHTVTSNDNSFNSGNLTNGQTFSYTFSNVGTYNYHCTFHSNMTGTVTVK